MITVGPSGADYTLRADLVSRPEKQGHASACAHGQMHVNTCLCMQTPARAQRAPTAEAEQAAAKIR